MGITELLADFLQPVTDLCPRVEPRPSTCETLVVDSPLGVRSTTWPVIFVPAFTHVERYPRGEYPLDLGLQRILTADGHTVSVNGTCIIRVVDPVALRSRIPYDVWEETLSQLMRGCLTEVMTAHNLTHLVDKGADLIWEDCAATAGWYGVEVETVTLEDLTTATPVSLLSNAV